MYNYCIKKSKTRRVWKISLERKLQI
jgi:hypothetical protein